MFNSIIIHILKGTRLSLFALSCTFIFLNAFNINIAKANIQNTSQILNTNLSQNLNTNLTLDNPLSVQLTHTSARITVEKQVHVNRQNNQTSIFFAIPHQAQDITISINGANIPRWSAKNGEIGKPQGKASLEHANLITEKNKTEAQMRTLQASISLWTAIPDANLPLSDLKNRQIRLENNIPNLEIKLAQTRQYYEKIKKQLSEFPELTTRIKAINAVVPSEFTKAKTVLVHYSYSLRNCGWLAQYQFNALPEQNIIQVRLFAKIWQYSGLDWKNTQITLLPLSFQNIEPNQLKPWYISLLQENNYYALNTSPRAMMLNSAPQASANLTSDTITIQDNSTFAGLSMQNYNIDEGQVKVSLNESQWNSKMLWLARPSTSSNVWLTVKHVLKNTSAWPAGDATFLIDNALIGNGSFSPTGNEVTIFFGVDPRLNVKSVADMLIKGKEGFIDKNKTWDWAWNYTIYNGRNSIAKVRVEEPEPQLGNKEFKVQYNSKPEPQIGKEHTLFWNIDVPAKKSITIKHILTISAPSELDINPGR